MQNRTLLQADYLGQGEAYHIARCPLKNGPPTLVHDHDFFEMFMVESVGAEHWVNGQMITLDRGALVFMRPSDTHALWCEHGPASVINLMFTAQTIQALNQRYEGQFSGPFFWSDGQMPFVLHANASDQMSTLRDINRLFVGPRSLARIEGFLIQLMSSVRVDDPQISGLPLWLKEALTRIDDPVFMRQGARGLSDACGKSHEHVCRVVKTHMNTTASDLMNARRMAFAAHELLTSNSPVTKIADMCGIENKSYFYRLFRAHHNVTPNEYRKVNRRDPVNLL